MTSVSRRPITSPQRAPSSIADSSCPTLVPENQENSCRPMPYGFATRSESGSAVPAARRAAAGAIAGTSASVKASSGNGATGGQLTRRQQNQWRSLTEEQRFYYQRQAKQMVESGLVG